MAARANYYASDRQVAYLRDLLKRAFGARIPSVFDWRHLERVTRPEASAEIDRLKAALDGLEASRWDGQPIPDDAAELEGRAVIVSSPGGRRARGRIVREAASTLGERCLEVDVPAWRQAAVLYRRGDVRLAQ